MTDTKHTPGPWTVYDHPALKGPIVLKEGTSKRICTQQGCGLDWDNLRLIAAAPDLLAELQYLVTLVANQDVAIARPGVDLAPYLASCRAAIAKAQGGAL